MSKLLFFDLETTGVKYWRNGIHQIGGIVDIDGQEAERFDIRLAPNPAATIEQEALDVAGVTLEQVQSYQPMEEGYRQLVGILSKYVNKFDKRDKMYLVGYNNAGFDNNFLRALFTQCGDKYFGSWFYPNCMDVYIIIYSHPSGMDRWEYKNSQSNCLKQLTGYFFCHTISVIFPCQSTN